MTKPLTTAQCVRWTFHAKAVDVLTTAGFTCLRQFQARTGPDSESFEVWAKDGRTVLLHFYAEGHGVELYAQCPGNSWDAMRAALANLGSFT